MGLEAYCAWHAVNLFRDYRETMTYAEYEAMCREMLDELIAAARAGG